MQTKRYCKYRLPRIKEQNQIGRSVALLHRLPPIPALNPPPSNGQDLQSPRPSPKTNLNRQFSQIKEYEYKKKTEKIEKQVEYYDCSLYV